MLTSVCRLRSLILLIPAVVVSIIISQQQLSLLTDDVRADSTRNPNSHRKLKFPAGPASQAHLCSRGVLNHDIVIRKNQEYLSHSIDPPADRWSGPHPVCGVNLLFNLTGELYLPSNISAGDDGKLQVRLTRCAKKVDRCTDLHVVSRLIGDVIISSSVIRDSDTCDFTVEADVSRESLSGAHRLEIFFVWLNGLGPDRTPPTRPILLRKIHSKFGRKPHQKFEFNGACEEQSQLVLPPFEINRSRSRNENHSLPLCTAHHRYGDGRWVRNNNDEQCNISSPACFGDPSLLNDAKPFNEDFLWSPYECRFQFYGRRDGPAKQCVKRKGPMLLMGDSTTREYAQNLKLFDLSRSALNPTYANWKLEWQYFSRAMAEKSVSRLRHELEATQPVVLVVNLGPLHLIGGLNTADWVFYVELWAKLFRTNFTFIERKIFLETAAIHYATNDMTAQRMLIWMEAARRILQPIGFEFIPAWNITASRYDSSWDGVHYSAERGKAQMKNARKKRRLLKWNGGVSIMLTTVLINHLCNFPA